ncbi:hypothetical protein B0H16DRAFT_1767334 [Mycena metata]|uniref:Uncharacterized protein n=1 Tax=Mycena metata TaxID=1033252 RepID=A0AAD7I571_9AGAR|nr:hypothetical protein B0H16DRAFT_1767334 [Mycena metata]
MDSRRNSVITSLRPENLKSSDFVDLSGISSSYLAFGLSGCDTLFRYKFSGKVPFPARTWGYLYYRPSSAWTPLAGSVRLRIKSDDAHGSDLLLPNGLPWQIILPQIVLRRQYKGLYRKLLEEGLISESDVGTCRNVFGRRRLIYPETVLFGLDQPFSISMQQMELRLTIVGRSSPGTRLALFIKQRLFGDPAPRYPFKGRILARFELSPDKALVFMRFVKIVEPIVCCEPGYAGRIVARKEGELLS